MFLNFKKDKLKKKKLVGQVLCFAKYRKLSFLGPFLGKCSFMLKNTIKIGISAHV